MEYELLLHLAGDPQRVFSRRELLRSVWGYQAPGCTRTLDSHASRLRRKLSAADEHWIVNVRGIGYRQKPQSQRRVSRTGSRAKLLPATSGSITGVLEEWKRSQTGWCVLATGR
jgi:DNA-binding winged helix-turn-helix (wHTH) protein